MSRLILFTGAGGMVGSYIYDVFKKENITLTDVNRGPGIDTDLDVSCHKHVDILRNKMFFNSPPTHIIHLAAMTDLEACEDDPSQAYRVNTIGTANVVELAKRTKAVLVYISTAGVFDGTKKSPYHESDRPNPINIYGMSKYYGEILVRSYPKHYILRAGWMMGGGLHIDKKFVAKIIAVARQGIAKNGKAILRVIDNSFGSPTYALDLLKATRWVIDSEAPFGTYHCCGKGVASRWEVAVEALKAANVQAEVLPVRADQYADERHTCHRSMNETMDIGKIEKAGFGMRGWREALTEYVKASYRGGE